MAKSQSTPRPISFEEMDVIDCDVHVMNPEPIQKAKAEYMSEPYRSATDPDVDSIGGYPRSGSLVEVPGEWEGVPLGAEDDRGLIDDTKDVREPLVDEFGIDYPILNMGAGGVNGYPNSEFREEAMRATNNVLLDRFLDDNDDFFGVATVATSLPEKAAEEIDRMADEESIVGLYTATSMIDPPLGDPQYDVMYEAAEDNDLPFVLHSAPSNIQAPNLDDRYDSFLELHTLGHPMSHMINLVSMIYRGVPEKYPDLDFVFVESGLGWAAYLKGRLNREYAERRFDAPLLRKDPGEYIDDSFYFGNQPIEEYADPTKILNTVETLGVENVVFATDFPHFDFDHPSIMNKYYGSLSQEDRRRIFCDNAAEVFGLEDLV